MRVLIVGAGFGGVAAAIELRRHGIDDVTILEKAPDFGGTWFYNSYPGCACDVPSQLYSFSFAQRRDWSRLCSPQEEILDYLHGVARSLGIDRLIKTNTRVTGCRWEDAACRWSVTTEAGDVHEADAIIIATGQLHQPSIPAIPGAERFAGHSFHSARWDHDYDLTDKRVAVVGTGASAVQFVPEVAERADELTVFQRTGNWFLPRQNRRYRPRVKALIEHVPGVQAYRRWFMFEYCEALTLAIRHPRTFGHLLHLRSALFMRSQLRDPELRRRVWPDYTFGCKRVLFSSTFLATLGQPNVELVTERIEQMTPEGILTADGRRHDVDCVIWGTGFKTMDFMFPLEIIGAQGRDLRQTWAHGAHAHLGMTVPGFPSMFVMYGPNTNTSGGSIIFYEEAQAAYIRQALQHLKQRGGGALEVRPEVEAATDRELQARFAGTAWTRCDSWYRDTTGRIVTNWPGFMRDYLERTREFAPGDFRFTPKPAPVAV
ncbi:MAG TPA: NAD(P)/FAD-dependent oxidoreductase [Solirubrobacteraceae bacterium]|nr:NAD(P)/FAD-dependent oxidoreductase [Solirubrobacteraceae bacterium]